MPVRPYNNCLPCYFPVFCREFPVEPLEIAVLLRVVAVNKIKTLDILRTSMYHCMMNDINKELMASSLAPIVLMILRSQESYGYQIIQELQDKTKGQLNVAEGTLYPVLKKMEAKEWIEGNWKKADTGRERRYYSITSKGKQELEQQYSQWNFINDLIHKLWNLPISISNNLSTITSTSLKTRAI